MGGRKAAAPGDEDFWTGSRERKPTPPRKRRRRRLLVWGGGGLLAALAVLLVFAPRLAAAVARPRVERAVDSKIAGSLGLPRLSLSWLGPQVVGPLTLRDPEGKSVAEVSVRVSGGLLGFARMNFNFGDATIKGRATIVRRADGTTNIERALASPAPGTPAKPSAGGGGGGAAPPVVPASLAGKVLLDNFEATFTDEAAGPGAVEFISLSGVRAEAAVGAGVPATFTLGAKAAYRKSGDRALTDAGEVKIDATARDLIGAGGRIDTRGARIEATATVRGVAVALADTLAGQEGRLTAAAGDTLDVKATASGTLESLLASLDVESAGLGVDAEARVSAEAVSLVSPAVVRVRGSGFVGLSPALAGALDAQRLVRIDRVPDATLTVESASVRLPKGGRLDLRGSGVKATLAVGEAVATSTGGRAEVYRVDPFEVRIEAPDLSKGVTLRTRAAATIGGSQAGSLTVDFTASELLDAAGAPRAGGPGLVNGTARLSDLRTELAQPFVEAAGLALAEDVGPVLNVSLSADGSPSPQGGQTDVRLAIDSANITGEVAATRTGGVVNAGGEFRVVRTGPLATRLLKQANVTVTTPTALSLRIRDLAVDTARLAAAGEAPDLGAASGVVALDLEAAKGTAIFQPGGKPEPWELSATTLVVDAADLSKAAVARLKTTASLAGEPPGSIDAEVIAAGLGEAAARRGRPGQVNVRANIKAVPTRLAQPFLPPAIDLARDIGPRLDLNVVANTRPNQAGAGPIPATAVTLDLRTQNVSTTAKLAVLDGAASLLEPVTLTVENTGGPLAQLLPPDLGYTLQQGGRTVVKVTELKIPLEGDGASPNLGKAAAAAEVTTGGLTLVPRQPGAVLAVESFRVGVKQAPGADPSVTLNGALRHQDEQGTLAGEVALKGLYGFSPQGRFSLTPAKALPVGSVAIDLPTSLARLVPADGKDLPALVREAVGPRVSVEVAMSPKAPAEGQPPGIDATVTLKSEGVSGETVAVVNEARIDLARAGLRAAVTPATLDRVMAAYAPGVTPRPRLWQATAATLDLGPLRLPRSASGGLNLARAGAARFTAGLEGRAGVDGLVLKNADGTTRDLGPVGVQDVRLTGTLPVSAVAQGLAPGEAQATLSASLMGAGDQRLGGVAADLAVSIAGSRPMGPASATVKVQNLQTTWVDAIAAEQGLVSGALGPTFSVEARFAGRFADADAGAGATGPTLKDGKLTALLASPRLAMKEPATIEVGADRLGVRASPLTWKMDPAWANRFALKTPETGEAARFDRPADITLDLKSLSLGRGTAGPLAPAVFALDATVSSPLVSLAIPGQQTAGFRNMSAVVRSSSEPGSVTFDIRAADAAGSAQPMRVQGVIAGLADAQGHVQAGAARLTADVAVPGLPTALIDALANQGGLLVESLGPVVTLDAKARDLSKTAGTIDANLTTPNASAHVQGRLEGTRFVATAPVEATLKRITPGLAAQLSSAVPVIGSFEKTDADTPATLVVQNLTAPLGPDMSQLNGTFRFDPGTARFATGDKFSKILKFLEQKREGQVGRRLEPFTITFDKGVGRYDRYKIPLGEFTLESKGERVDLVGKSIDVVTYIPLGQLTDEAAGLFNSGLGGALGRAVPGLEGATMIPWRTRGPMSAPSTSPDIGLFVQEVGPGLLQGVGRSLEEVLRGIGGGGR